jgi:predicted TIM-barrel fold metal-dependent hydrolase
LRPSGSTAIRAQVWLTSQPIEEADDRRHLADRIDWIGRDRLMFATDLPHRDFDDPSRVRTIPADTARRRGVLPDNAARLQLGA